MKFLHAADLHLDSPLQGLERYEGAPVDLIRGATRRALENLVNLAIRERVDFVVISGDLYDGDWRDFNTGMFFVRQMARLSDSGIRVYLIAGNHDAASTMTRTLRLPVNPEGDSLMFSHEQAETRLLDHLGVAIHARSFASQVQSENMVPAYPMAVPHFFNLGLLHTSLSGSEEHDTYAPCTPADLRLKGYDYWALGHIHKRSLLPGEVTNAFLSGPPILYSGNIQGRHIREAGPRGCFLVNLDESNELNIRFQPLDVFRWETCEVSCEDVKNTDDVYERFRNVLSGLVGNNPGLPLGVRVTLVGASEIHQVLVSQREKMTAEIRSTATIDSKETVWVEQVKVRTQYPREKNRASTAEGPLMELVRYLDQLADDDVAIGTLAEELKDLSKKLPGELTQSPEGIPLDQIEWLKEVVRDIKPMLLDRLNG